MDKKKKKFIIGSLIIIGATIYLVVTGISRTSIYYMHVSELLERGDSIYNQGVRVEGKVLSGSIIKGPSPLIVDFKITDGEKDIPVHYKGVIPDMFDDDRDVVIEGVFKPSGEFEARTIMTSCPSKYEAEQETSPLKKFQKKT